MLALGAFGVVYGDIGTSPLYAIRECFHGHHAIALTQGNIFGVMSLVFWSLTVVVSVKIIVALDIAALLNLTKHLSKPIFDVTIRPAGK